LPKVPEGKRGMFVYIDDDVYNKLVNLIRKKFTKLHGALSFEVQDALVHWISEHEETLDMHTNTHKLVNPVIPRSHIYAREIVDNLKNRGFTLQLSIKDLHRAIGETRGSDPRTFKKWAQFLVEHGYMKWITHRLLEMV